MQLFLQGYSLKDIQKLNPGYKLGLLVQARLDHEWDRHKAEYIEGLMGQTAMRVQKSQLEAIQLATDAVAVHQRVLGSAFKKFLQTGLESDLGPNFKDQINLRNLKEWTALLMTLTGQDKQKQQVVGEITHKVEGLDPAAQDGAALLMAMDKK